MGSEGSRSRRAFRSVTTNRWVDSSSARRRTKLSGSVCVQGTDGTKKQSNRACASNVIK